MPRNNALDIDAIIKGAELGRSRRDAQEDTCAVFAAALYDVLSAHGIPCQLVTAVNKWGTAWAHAVVEVAGRYYDSMGEFSTSIYRARAKIHPTVSLDIGFQPDSRSDCYEPELDELRDFYAKMLDKAMSASVAVQGV
ncbi:conserved protein of unknown function (plasmid) [Cupriavidus taiwanensis]|uniref:Uncharacterized protein n=1 Tax=Cupriavidus taiwanensis TaxID=164546 RepID=A0A375ISR1_9BURK|nr:conserved protein of unknown function [Cupriavidus taiwanensis]